MLRLRIFLGIVLVVLFCLVASRNAEAENVEEKINKEISNKTTITLFDITSAQLLCSDIGEGFDLFSIRFVSEDNYTVICSNVQTAQDAIMERVRLKTFFKEKIAPKMIEKLDNRYKIL